jgi:hypothetical protein
MRRIAFSTHGFYGNSIMPRNGNAKSLVNSPVAGEALTGEFYIVREAVL